MASQTGHAGAVASVDAELKQRHRAMWASGHYDRVAREVIPHLGRRVVEAVQVMPGEDVLDVAAGHGNASVPAAMAGARVVASDLTPELLEVGRLENPGLDIRWEVADAEALPWADGTFDVVLSTVGVMFAPHHQRAADELLRVLRPGGRVGIISWTPEGFVGRLFATMRNFVLPPPPGAQPPPMWGTESHVRELFGDRVRDIELLRDHVEVAQFPGRQDFRSFFRENYGPTVAAYRGLADRPDRTAALDAALDALAASADEGGGLMRWEYALITGRRR